MPRNNRLRRDMARRRMMRRDGRNPYGSRGGYVVNSRRDRARRLSDMNMDYRRGDYAYDNDYAMGDDVYGYRERPTLYRGVEREERKYENSNPDGEQYSRYDGGSYYPFEVSGSYSRYDTRGGMGDYGYGDMRRDYRRGGSYGRRDGRYDYASGDYLEDDELMDWQDELMEELDEKDKQLLKKDMIMKKAEEMGIKFDKFSEEEFYTTVLMLYSDYKKSLGSANADIYIKLAKDWMSDQDSELTDGEKLATYYYEVVCGGE